MNAPDDALKLRERTSNTVATNPKRPALPPVPWGGEEADDASATAIRNGAALDAFRKRLARIDPESLRLFVEVVEQGTITGAARHEHIVATAVSKRITKLEEVLRTRLVVRSNRGLQPTPAGHALIKLSRRVLSDLEHLYVQMLEYSEGVRGHVRLSANVSAITEFLPAEIKSFLARYPQIEIEIEERSSTEVARLVADGAADVGVMSMGVAHPYALETFPYHVHELVVVAPHAHPLATKPSVSFEETLAFEYVGLHSGSALGLRMQDAAAALRRALKLRIQVSAYDALCRMVEAGLGIGILPRAAAQPYVDDGRIRAIRLDEAWAVRELRLCVAPSAPLPVAARLLVEHLRAAVAP